MREGYRIRGQYELIEVAGRGGMAVVWRARQQGAHGFERTVAVKQMHEHLSESKIYVDMFAEEARVCATLQSPNIAQVYDFVAEEGHYYLVLEWIEGIDLGSYIRHFVRREQPTPWEHVTAIGVGVLRALADAHERVAPEGGEASVIHRDVSPHNVLVSTRGQVKLIDFGLSLANDRTGDLTEPGVVKGKMAYLSPEVVGGARPCEASDQFAVGSLLWEALVGRKLFEGQNDFEIYSKVRDGLVSPLRPFRRDIPRGLVAVINRALSRDIDRRFSSVREMGRHLSQVLKSARVSRDLFGVIGETVVEARESLEMGRRTGEPSTTTPIAEPEFEMVKIPQLAVQSASGRMRSGTDPIPVKVDERQRGLLHRLPFIGRRR